MLLPLFATEASAFASVLKLRSISVFISRNLIFSFALISASACLSFSTSAVTPRWLRLIGIFQIQLSEAIVVGDIAVCFRINAAN